MAKRPQYSEVQFGFDVRSDSPIDRRLVLTKEEMETMTLLPGCGKAINLAAVMPDDYLVLCADNGRLYHYSRLSGKECCDCSIDENKKDWPFGTSNGHFRLFTDVIDIVHKEGDSWESIVDKCGIAKVCSYEDMQTIYEEMERRFKNLEASLAEKADKCEVEDVNVRIDNLEPRVEDLETYKADKFIVVGSGDKLDSEGFPVPKDETENDAYGVHVKYDPVDSEGKPLYPKNDKWGVKGPVILIDHDYRFTSTITSKFDIGGIGKGQTILKGTPLETFLWQLLRGDPVIENIIYWKASNILPVVPPSGLSPTTWAALAPWGGQKTITNDDLLITPDPLGTWKGVLSLGNLIINDQYVMLAVPRSNSTGFKPDDTGAWVVPLLNSEKAPHGIELREIYLKDAPAFKYEFKKLEIRNDDESTDWGYMIYYIDRKVYYPSGDQEWIVEFVPRP